MLKWGTLGSNLLKCPYGQMGTKPAKVGHLAANLLKKRRKKTKTKKAPRRGSNPRSKADFGANPSPFDVPPLGFASKSAVFCLQIDSHKKAFAPRADLIC